MEGTLGFPPSLISNVRLKTGALIPLCGLHQSIEIHEGPAKRISILLSQLTWEERHSSG